MNATNLTLTRELKSKDDFNLGEESTEAKTVEVDTGGSSSVDY